MAWGGGRAEPTPGLPLPSSDSLPGSSTHFFQQEAEAHGEEEVGEEGAGEAGRPGTMKAEVRGPWTPHPHPHPREG